MAIIPWTQGVLATAPTHSVPRHKYKSPCKPTVFDGNAIIQAYALTAVDIETLTQPFRDLHVDPAMAMDTAAGTFITIQLNLVAGTLVRYLKDSPSLNALMNDILAFDILKAHFCLTEVGHGLDAINIETTALLPDGSLNCILRIWVPLSLIMPPTSPCGIPAVGIVFAKLIVKGDDYGIRPFILS
ncbi:hypothetical protein C8J57DRAFT_1530882 [Mycena rebaudengoi]|nr:hypothetical protein C8J57DRAFT_1530882 [Mycena rebaudengoi]